jgi:hypothetical protein
MGSGRKMQSKMMLLAVLTVPLLFTGCGGGDNTNPYDGTWMAVYPPLSKDSTITPDKVVTCSNPGTSIDIKNSAGTTRITATCKTDIYDTTTTPPTLTSSTSATDYVDVGVNIVKQAADQKDVMNATVNGAVFVGPCISTQTCSATNGTDSLSLTR